MSDHLRAADRWMQAHHGVLTRTALLELGFSPGGADRFVRSQRLVRIARAVYLSPAHPTTRHQLMAAACLAHPAAHVSFTTGAGEWGFRGMRDPIVHVLLPHAARAEVIPGVEVHRTRRLDPVDVVAQRPDGIRLTSPPRALLDAAAIVSAEAAESAIEQALAEERVTIATLLATSRRLDHPRRPGATTFRKILEGRPLWRRAVRSDLELKFRRAVDACRLPPPVVNHHVVLYDGTPVEIDLAWPEQLVALEVDHPAWHDGARDAQADKRRDRLLGGTGWLPQRVTELDIEGDLGRTLDELEVTLVRRGWRRPDAA